MNTKLPCATLVLPAVLLACVAASPLAAQGIITTLAGADWVFPGDGGSALDAPLGGISGLSLDDNGELFLADPDNLMLMRVDPDGTLEVIAGTGIRVTAGDEGPALTASLRGPAKLTRDAMGNLCFIDIDPNFGVRLRQLTPDGLMVHLAGRGPFGFDGDGGPAIEALFRFPEDLTAGPGGVYVADTGNDRIRLISNGGMISTFAGNGERGFSGDGEPATIASLNRPSAVALNSSNELFIGDNGNRRIRKIGPKGLITTVAGTGENAFSPDGIPAQQASLGDVGSIAFDDADNLYLSETFDGIARIRRIDGEGIITTIPVGDVGSETPIGFVFSVADMEVGPGPRPTLYFADAQRDSILGVNTATGDVMPVGGNGRFRVVPDGTLASRSPLNRPFAVATDGIGNVYIGEGERPRIRRITPDGRMFVVAGTGLADFSPFENTPALDTNLALPAGIVALPGNELLFSETAGHRVRRLVMPVTIAPILGGGTIQTIAGTGTSGVSGDGGPALKAQLERPGGIALDSLGSLFIASRRRVRRVDPMAVISTVAGQLREPFDVAVDDQDTLYVAENGAHRVVVLSPEGGLIPFAGTGEQGSGGDGGPATRASLTLPAGLAADAGGNLFISELSHAVRRVDAAGIIDTVAGIHEMGFSGDGGPATMARLNTPAGVAVDSAGNLLIADFANDRVRVVLSEAPAFFALDPPNLEFSGVAGGPSTQGRLATVQNVLGGILFATTAETKDGGNWLKVQPAIGASPGRIRVKADPVQLSAGQYAGSVNVTMRGALPEQRSIPVVFNVAAAPPPQLVVTIPGLTFSYPRGAPARTQSFHIGNAGGGSLPFSIVVSTESGGEWLSVSELEGSATSRLPFRVTVTADPVGLPAGVYRGFIRIESPESLNPRIVPVNMLISDLSEALRLSKAGLSFVAVEGSSLVSTQSFGITNLGTGSVEWSASVSTLTGGGWLGIAATIGKATSGVPAVVDVSADASGLAAGSYYGLIEVEAEAAANSSLAVTAHLEVVPESEDPGPTVTPSGLFFNGLTLDASPGAKKMYISSLSPNEKVFEAVVSTENRINWLKVLPGSGPVSPVSPTGLLVQPLSDGLDAGVYEGKISLQFSDGTLRTVPVVMVLRAGSVEAAKLPIQAANGCTPATLQPAIQTLGDGFSVSAGWPMGLEVDVMDDCGEAMESGSVVVEFSNGDPDLVLTHLEGGRWDGTWDIGPAAVEEIVLRVEAENPGPPLLGTQELYGGVRLPQEAPILPSEGIVSAASFGHVPIAPGALISLFGLNLSEAVFTVKDLPLPTTESGTTITIAGVPMPLLYTSEGQVNAQVPYGININTTHQVLLRRGDTFATPAPIDVAAAQPAVFLAPQAQAPQQGHIYRFVSEADQPLAAPGNPAAAKDFLIIYCSGLGETGPAVIAGEAAPGQEPLSRTVDPVVVTIGGVDAKVNFAGLTPFFSGLYQVNVQVRSGVTPGDQVPLVLTVGGQASPPVTIAIE